MSRSQTPDLDRVEREERGETLRDERERRLARELTEEVTHRMSTVLGRRSVARQLADCGWWETPKSLNHAEAQFKAGRHEVASELVRAIRTHCHREWMLLQQEEHERESAMEAERELDR